MKAAGHVLVVGVDGVRSDLLGPDRTPSIWALGQDGFLAPVPVDETTPTWSGPCWATIATGTGVDGHAITGNDLTGHRLADHPDFVTLATRAGLPTLLAVSGWPPLALAADGGPLFAEASRREFVAVPETSLAWDRRRNQPGDLGCRRRGHHPARRGPSWPQDAPRVSFVYLGGVDIAGHRDRRGGRLPNGRPGPPTSGSGGCWAPSGPAGPTSGRTGRSWWSPTTGTSTGAGTAAASLRSPPRGRPPPDLASGRGPRR